MENRNTNLSQKHKKKKKNVNQNKFSINIFFNSEKFIKINFCCLDGTVDYIKFT